MLTRFAPAGHHADASHNEVPHEFIPAPLPHRMPASAGGNRTPQPGQPAKEYEPEGGAATNRSCQRVVNRAGEVIVTSGQLARVGRLVLRLLVAAGLAVDAYVHADLAPVYAGIHASISQGSL